jgi:ketosteroid isomerase-like protein
MSQENVDHVRQMYEAFDRGDLDRALSCLDPEVVMDATHRVDGAIGHGREEATAILAEWLDTWDEWREELEEIRDLGSQVLVVSIQRGRGKESGIEWDNRFAMLYELRNDKITRWTVYDHLHRALEAAGLRA